MPKISFIMITARTAHPYLGREDLHVFEPTLKSFQQQRFLDFEWIVVDALYEERKDYFLHQELPFRVKHIPAQPNLWLDKGFPGICHQYNKGIIYADGELLFFTGDSHMMLPTFMEQLWTQYQAGYFPLAWYFFDNSFTSERCLDQTRKKEFDIAYPSQESTAPLSYNLLGYTGANVSIEHRYLKAFSGNTHTCYPAPWVWWFGCSSASLESMLTINGFDEKFDGDRMLLDCDVGSRLDLAGYGPRLALFRDLVLIRAATNINKWHPHLEKDKVTIKCNYPLIWFSRFFNRYQANTYTLTDKDIQWIKEVFCPSHCPIRELCQREHAWQFPFEHKAGYPGHHSSKRWFNFWMAHQGLTDLRAEREFRLNGHEKYQHGTFIG